MRKWWLVLLVLLVGCSVNAETIVKVGGYEFPPFVEVDPKGNLSGVTVELIEEMNRFQSQYRFTMVETSPRRRYQHFEEGLYDVIFFESLQWGWETAKTPVEASRVFLLGGEKYVTLAKEGRDQSYFDDFTGKTMIGMLGYHYGFAGFNADPDFLKTRYRMILVTKPKSLLQNLIDQPGAVAVVTISYLKRYLANRPPDHPAFLVSDKLDQEYRHTILVRKGGTPSVDEINTLLTDMENSGALEAFWKKNDLK